MNPSIPMSPKGLYEFGPFRLDSSKHLLLKDSKALPLPPKAFEILVLLVEKRGALMAKGDLLHAVWPNTFVEENNLTQYVSMLRKVLGDGVDDQKYIQTVPKLGYRFVSNVREIGEGDGDLLLAKHTRTRIVVREEKEEESGEFQGDSISLVPVAGANLEGPSTHTAAPAAPVRGGTITLERVRKWVFASSVVVAGAVGALVLFRGMRPHASEDRTAVSVQQTFKPRYSVAVLGFKNLSGREEDNWLSAALAEMLTTELSAGGQLQMVSGEDVTRMKLDLKLSEAESLAKPTLIQIRNHVGADITVSGSYVELGRGASKQIRLDLRLQDTSAGETIFSIAETGTVEELFMLISHSGTRLRAKLGTPVVSTLDEAQAQAALPSTPEAARLYSQGLSRLRAFDGPTAQKLLAKAVSVDPNFALGHSALAAAWSTLGYDERAKAEARRALDLSYNLSRQEHLLIAGQYSELSRDWDKAVETYVQLFGLYPDSLEYGLRLASAQTSAGKGKDASATLEKLRQLSPPACQDPQIDLAQAAAAESLGDFKQEREASERGGRNGEILGERLLVARSWVRKGWALRRLGQTQEAIDGLLEAKKLFSEAGDMQGVGSTLHLIGGVQSERGDFAQAAQSYREAQAIFRRIGDKRALALSINGLAIVQYERSDLRGAKALYKQYLEIEREVGSKINTAGALGNIANVADAQGDLAEARRLNEESLKIFAEVGDQRAMGTALGNLAILLYEQGDLQGARKRFEDALEIKRKIGYQRGIAYDLAGLSEIFRAQGNLTAAREKQEESLAIRTQLGEKHNAAASRLYLAILALEEQRPADAEKIATETAEEFKKEKSAADEAAAEEVEARSFLAQGKLSEAQAAIGHATALSRRTTNLPLGFDISMTSARLSVVGKTPPNPSSVAKAEKNLESSLAVARRCGYLEYEYKLGLVLGEIELRSGHIDQGRARIEALEHAAKAKGLGLMDRNATLTLERQSVEQ